MLGKMTTIVGQFTYYMGILLLQGPSLLYLWGKLLCYWAGPFYYWEMSQIHVKYAQKRVK